MFLPEIIILVNINWLKVKQKPGFQCRRDLFDGHWLCSKNECIDQQFHLRKQEGYSDGVTKQWPSQQLYAQLVSILVAENAGSTPGADHNITFKSILEASTHIEDRLILRKHTKNELPDYHFHQMQVLYHHETISSRIPTQAIKG